MTEQYEKGDGPLSGIRVLDFTALLQGPLATSLPGLARFAAERGEFSKAREMFERAWGLALKHGSRIDQHFAAAGMYRIQLTLEGPESARRWQEIRAQAARELGARELIVRAAEFEGDLLYELGEYERSRDALARGIATMDPLTMRGTVPELRWKMARSLLALGDLDRARAEAELARAETGADDQFSQGTTRAALAAVRAAEGRDMEAEALYREAIALLSRAQPLEANERRIELARFLIQRGRGAEARADLERLRDFYSDPAAARPRAEVEALLAQTVTVRA